MYQRVLDEIYLFLCKRRNVSVAPLINTEQPRDRVQQELLSNAEKTSLCCVLD